MSQFWVYIAHDILTVIGTIIHVRSICCSLYSFACCVFNNCISLIFTLNDLCLYDGFFYLSFIYSIIFLIEIWNINQVYVNLAIVVYYLMFELAFSNSHYADCLFVDHSDCYIMSPATNIDLVHQINALICCTAHVACCFPCYQNCLSNSVNFLNCVNVPIVNNLHV